uniref:Uncharacterized protein n=1 Tax=Populus trichocarpa TaxID=3694 RepID=A0A3N7F624_POPTR
MAGALHWIFNMQQDNYLDDWALHVSGDKRFFAGMAVSTEAILSITTQSTRIAISTVHKLKINCLRFISSSSCPSQNYVALSFPGGENLNVFPSIYRSSFLALILFCCWDPKDMNSQLFSLLFIEITIEEEIYIY